MLPANLSLPPLSSLNPNPSSARQKSNPVLHHGCLMALFLCSLNLASNSLQSYIRFLSRAPPLPHACINLLPKSRSSFAAEHHGSKIPPCGRSENQLTCPVLTCGAEIESKILRLLPICNTRHLLECRVRGIQETIRQFSISTIC